MAVRELIKSRLFIILTITVIYIFAINITRPIVSLYAVHMGTSAFLLGLLVSTYAVFPVLFSVQSGKWADRIGSKRMIYIGGAGFVVALLIPAAFPHIATLFFSQAVVGLAHNFMMIALQRGASSAGENRDKAIASLSLAISTGEFLGPLLGGFSYEHLGFQITFALTAVSVLLIFLLNTLLPLKAVASVLKEAEKRKTSSFTLLKSVNIRKALLSSGLVIYSKDLFVAYFPMYGSKIGLSPSQIGLVLAASAAASMFVRAIQYPLVEKFTRSVVLVGSLLLGGAAYIAVPFLHNFVILCALGILLGAGLGLGQPLSIVYILNSSPPGRVGELLGMRITFNRLCQMSAPAFYGVLGGTLGISPIFWTCGMFLLFGSWYSRDDKKSASAGAEVSSP